MVSSQYMLLEILSLEIYPNVTNTMVNRSLALIEHFSLGVTAEALRAYERLLIRNRRFPSNGGRLTQNLG